ncbi:MAG: hypothetical protein CM15mP56_5260 [Alphaproteobacteria bacterium]|nr:MAG: hypothetical protein CM15mP56_5260 [Alphaproteobacteria bacterium]
MKTFNIIKFENIFLIFLIYFFIKISFGTNQAVVKNIYIELELKENVDHRTIAIETSYKIALSRYLKWITLKETSDIINLVDLLEARDYVSGYSIENEKYKREKYSALITVTFEKNKLEKFLESKNIEFFSKKGPKTLIIPIINFEQRLILWDDPNPWFDVWLRRPLDSNLNLFTLPTGEADDLITLSAQDAVNLKYFKIKKLANKYEAEQAYVLLVNVESYNEKFNLSVEVYNGLTQDFIFSSDIENIEIYNFDYNLNVLADTFADYFDDLWVKENLDNINSETKVLAEISYKKYNEWIKIKNFLINNEKILKYNILIISNKNALIELNILSIDDLVEDLERNRFKIYKKENNLFISKDES